ncbi:MAG: hypothetical protein LC778_10195 [Acidobacteria bacterium]|nr:hypothetical protein [Acidobacteriota bacterium]
MDVQTLANELDVNVKVLCRFLKEWSGTEITVLDTSSVPVVRDAFLEWYGEPVKSVTTQSNEALADNGLIPLALLRRGGRGLRKNEKKRVYEIAVAQEQWLQERLTELGLNVSRKTRDPHWRNYPKWNERNS